MQNNYYGIPWQQSSQQINYGQIPPPFINQPQISYDSLNQFSTPPPPPPPENHPPPSEPMQNQHRNANMSMQSNFNQGFNDGRSQQNNYNNNNWQQQGNFRGNRRGNKRGGNSRFNDKNQQNFNNSNKFQFNDNQPKNQQPSNFGNNNRGKNMNKNSNNRGNWNKNNNNLQGSSSNADKTGLFDQGISQQPSFSFNTSAGSGVESFESEFRKWEAQFEQWLEEMKDHPDKQQYESHKKQFYECRQMLLNRLHKLKEKSVPVPSMTEEQIKFNNEWSNGNQKKDMKNPGRFQSANNFYEATTSTAQQLPPISFTPQIDLPASSILFGNPIAEQQVESFSVDDSDTNFVSFDHHSVEPGYSNFGKSQSVIPGLGYSAVLETNKEAETLDNTVVLDDEEPLRDLPAPPTPVFCLKKTRCVIKINDILEEPGRSNRFARILILIRGAPGSGKNHLAKLIEKKENQMGNERCRILSIKKYISSNFYDPKKVEEYDEKQFNEFKQTLQEGYIDFLIVVLNGCGMRQFNRLTHHAFGKFDCFSIEVHQTSEICQKYDVYRRNIIDIKNANEDLDRFPTPNKFKLLDPTSLYYPNESPSNREDNFQQNIHKNVIERSNPQERSFQHADRLQEQNPNIKNDSSNNSQSTSSAVPQQSDDFAKKMAQILQNENVLQLLQAHMNNTQPPSGQGQNSQQQTNNFPRQFHHRGKPGKNFQNQQNNPHQQNLEPPPSNKVSIDECPVFKPAKIIDYNHIHKQTFEESLLEFKVFRTIDYNHYSSYKINDFIKDVDVDKIIEKRKAIALRKKILEYLRNAERPEDTVSNPKYPRNWEVIEHERPPRKSKRRKRHTAKIKRVLLRLQNENWMIKGYTGDENQQMDLEAISSDSDNDDLSDHHVTKKPKLDESPIFEDIFVDEYKDVYKTIPDFNHFNHQKYVNIKNVLYPSERRSRPSKILIILRGAPGSGKSHCAQLIKRKESQIGNASDIRILSIDDYFLTEEDEDEDNDPESQAIAKQRYLDQIQRQLKKTITENLYNLIIIDAENCDLNSYNQFYSIGSSMGFTVFTIELYQTAEICKKQCKRTSAIEDIPKVIDLLNVNRIPKDHTLLIPSKLYDEFDCFVNPSLVEKQQQSENKIETTDSIRNYQNFLVQTMDDDNFLSLMPQFNWHNREIVDIREIIEEPGRSKRSQNIAIIMRGPGGSGKHELGTMILNKEREHGNENTIFVTIEDFFINESTNKYEFDSRNLDENVRKLFRRIMELTRSKKYNFMIVDAETGDFSHYMQIYELLASKQGQCFTIETYQDASICSENDIYKRPIKDIESILEEIQLNKTPDDHILLDASMFYKHQPFDSLDKPLKSALKISPNTSFAVSKDESVDTNELDRIYDELTEGKTLHEKFQASFNQRVCVNGKFIERNSCPPANIPEFNWFNVKTKDIRDILEEPGRSERPDKIVIFIRGSPGSGKTFLAGLIARKELENGNQKNFQLLSIDEYFEMLKYRKTEVDGQYEKYIESNANSAQMDAYMAQLDEDFTSALESNEPSFIVLDGDFCDLKYYNEMWHKATSNGFSCYVIELNQDNNTCIKYNDHKWNESHILDRNKAMQNIQSPKEHILLDPEYLYHEYTYDFASEGDVFQANISDVNDDEEDNELSFGKFKMSAEKSKWDDYETPDIERLDGIKNKSSKRVTMADYLHTDDAEEWSMRPSTSGKKRVRWADIEEKKAQEHMRKIGFIVGHTDWERMNDRTDGKSALEKTKFIEPRKRK